MDQINQTAKTLNVTFFFDCRQTLSSSSMGGEWQVSSTTESGWEEKKNDHVVNELFKMSTSGYTAPVSTWNGTRSQLDKEVQQERREERKRTLADSSEDQGRAKHSKVTSTFKGKSNSGYNPVQVGYSCHFSFWYRFVKLMVYSRSTTTV